MGLVQLTEIASNWPVADTLDGTLGAVVSVAAVGVAVT